MIQLGGLGSIHMLATQEGKGNQHTSWQKDTNTQERKHTENKPKTQNNLPKMPRHQDKNLNYSKPKKHTKTYQN